ncbi:hypothetical protein LAZ67_13002415 [Cordylochernes scorpioides]|uniref:Uncharacterized protein n=1 Tax=Cordylochernes scorpioides TaxID=51811 RepID=A0ABY6L5D4_9ARAC|nr:hypothetical protein LAZ67_13002415 [Cordylochernes scorpioides]
MPRLLQNIWNKVIVKIEKLASFDADALYSQVEGIITNETTGQSFEKGNLLGKGGNGCCFKVRDIKSNETLACKASKKCRRSLYEAKMLKSLDHPNIVKCFQHFCDEKFQYILMERCDSSLDDVCLKKEKDVNSIQNYVHQIAKACHYLHTEKHIIHGDLKPGNILLKDGVVKLADFGNSRRLSSINKKIKHKGGTLVYKAPEIILKQLCGVEIDCWALGCTIFKLFEGKAVFTRKNDKKIEHIFMNDTFKVPLTSCSEANTLITGLLEPNPELRKITVHLNNKKSRPRTLNNGLPQGSVLAPLLFNVYTADIPATNSQKFLYADDIALLHQEQSFSTLEQILNEDLKKLENFFSKWHLIPNPSKTVSSVFHLNNHKANRPLKLTFCNKPLSHDPCPKYLGVTLDRSLTFRQHLEKTRDKLKTRNNIMTRLAGTTWGCSADTLRTSALALVYSVAEYCAPVWERSSHTDSIDAQLNQTMRLITGNMRPTPIDWLPYLSNIAPPDLRRKKSTSNLLSKIKANTKLPINTVLEIPPPTRLISRNPAWVADENVDLKEEWRNRWSNLAIANKDLVEDPNTKPPGYNLPRRTWSTLNRIRTSTGRCNYLLNKWNMSPDQNCDCGQIQTMHHILRDCPRRFFQGTLGDIHRCTEEALEWIRHLDIPL